MSEWNYLERIYAEVAPRVRLYKPPRAAHRLESPVLGTSSERGDCPWPVGFQTARAYGAESHNGDPRGVNLRQHWAHTWYWLLLPDISHCLGFFGLKEQVMLNLISPFSSQFLLRFIQFSPKKVKFYSCCPCSDGMRGSVWLYGYYGNKTCWNKENSTKWWHDHFFGLFF